MTTADERRFGAGVEKLVPPEGRPFYDPKTGQGLIPIILFPNMGRGFGYGETDLGLFGETLPEGYHYTINMWPQARAFSPSYAAANKWGLVGANKPSDLFAWADNSNNPTVVLLQDSLVKIVKNATITAETDATTATYGAGAFWDISAGTARYVVGTTTGSKFLNARENDGTWDTEGTNVGQYCTVAGSLFWATLNDYQIRNWTLANNPLSAAASGTFTVGSNATKIKSIGAIGSAVIVGKEDGLWVWHEADSKFANDFAFPYHPDNCLFMRPDNQGGILTARWDGALVHIDKYLNPTIFDPRKGKQAGRDTPRGKIVDACAYEDHFYVLVDGAARLTQQCGIKVVFYDDSAGTYSDYSTEAADARLDTVVNIGSMTPGDYLYIGADQKFLVMDMKIGTASSANARMTINFGNSGDSFTPGIGTADTFNGTDSTPATAATPFGQSGRISWNTDANLASWAKTTPSFLGVEKFWMRIGLQA